VIRSRVSVPEARLREVARDVAERFGLRLIVLFGSTAREEPEPRDLDLGMLGSDTLDVVAITNALIRALGTQSVDVTDLRRADPILLALAARDGKPLFETEPGLFADFVSVAARRFADTRKFRDARADVLRAAIGRRPAAP
jgi:predicted nucleotidyltransferase